VAVDRRTGNADFTSMAKFTPRTPGTVRPGVS
jgi:hypothetical protein